MDLIRDTVSRSENTDELTQLYSAVVKMENNLKPHEDDLKKECGIIRELITTRIDYIMVNNGLIGIS